jgi:hypothetical protein
MTEQQPPEDRTIDAIQQVIRTMGGDPQTDQQPASTSAEEYLIDQGVFTGRSTARRRLLGCLGCRLKGQGEEPSTVYATGLEKCTGGGHGATVSFLKELVRAGIFVEKIDSRFNRGRPRTTYRPSDSEQAAEFMDSLEVPAVCDLEQQPEARVRLNAEAEAHLIDTGVVSLASTARRAALGCLACQLPTWGDSVQVELSTIGACIGKSPKTVTRTLEPLVDADILSASKNPSVGHTGKGRPPTIYSFTDTLAADALRERLDTPEHCNLEGETS